jgi:hypothetical protein
VSETEIRHDLFVYESDAAAVAQIERFAVAGLEADESVMVVVSAAKQRLLREAFGAASEFVLFVDSREVYTRPEATMAAFDGVVRKSVEALDAGLRVYGELPSCRTQAEWNAWIAYEAAVNRAFANRPVVLMCGYDARVVPGTVVEQAWRAHRVVHAGGVWQINRDYEEPEAVVRSLAPAFEVLPGLRTLPLGDGPLRDRLAEAAEAEGVPAARVRDLLVAAGEVFSNAELYGCGVRSLRAGRVGSWFVCEVTDAGSGLDDALAGYLPPPPLAPVGAGLWIARQLTSRLELLSAPDGLTVRLWI